VEIDLFSRPVCRGNDASGPLTSLGGSSKTGRVPVTQGAAFIVQGCLGFRRSAHARSVMTSRNIACLPL
jgi:hypothetical protein